MILRRRTPVSIIINITFQVIIQMNNKQNMHKKYAIERCMFKKSSQGVGKCMHYFHANEG